MSESEDGVQRLIDRIREEAVAAGRSEAETLVAKAKAEAAQILEAAERERDELLRAARRELEIESQAARAAVQTAARDVVLGLEASVVARFEAHVAQRVDDTLRDPQLMRALVLTLAGRVAQQVLVDKNIEIMVAALLDERAADQPMPAQLRDGILGISQAMLREGVELRASPKISAGAKVALVGEAVEVDLSSQAIAQMLLAYLSPRFRWILQGAE